MRIMTLGDRILNGKSAYSKLGYEICTRLAKSGHKVAHTPIGRANKMGKQMTEGVLIQPSGDDYFSEDNALANYTDFRADMLISVKDTWVFNYIPKLCINYVPFAIIDHTPVSDSITGRLNYTFKNIAISRFGQMELRKKRLDSVYIPHAVNTEVFKPLSPEEKVKARDTFGLPQDAFVVGIVAMNRARKMIPRMLRGFKRFREQNPNVNAHLMLWMNIQPRRPSEDVTLGVSDVGVNLVPELFGLGINEYVHFPNWNDVEKLGGLPDSEPSTGRDMVHLYNSFDVNFLCSGGEAAGMPYLEANACFPADTTVDSNEIIGIHRRTTSDLLEIETETGYMCTPTPNHPMLTSFGWKMAKDINIGDTLFTGIENGQKDMDRRTISDIVNELSDEIVERIGDADFSYEKCCDVESQRPTPTEALQIPSKIQRFSVDGQRNELYRWNSGRRRNNWNLRKIGKAKGYANLSAYNNHQYKQKPYGLVEEQTSSTKHMDREVLRQPFSNETPSCLSLQHKRAIILPILPEVKSLSNYQKTTDGNNAEILRKSNRKDCLSRILRLRNGLTEANTCVERETVTKIKRIFRPTKVFNITTTSGLYFANNLLVHNCGVPSVGTNYAGAPEYIGPGFTVAWHDYEIFNTPGVRYVLPDIEGMMEALQKVYDADREKLSKKCRRFAMSYDWNLVMDAYWKPFLSDCAKELYPLISKDGEKSWA